MFKNSASIFKNERGYLAWTLLLPLILGAGAVMYQNQLDTAKHTANVQKITMAKNQMVSIKNWLITNASDVDADAYAELPKEGTGNILPASCSLKGTDDNGVPIKYETWDLGVSNTVNTNYSQNYTASPPKLGMIGRLTAAGADGKMGTADDIVMEIYNTDVMQFQNNSGFVDNVITHTVTQQNTNDQVVLGKTTPDGTAKLTVNNTLTGVVASLGSAWSSLVNLISFKTNGVEVGELQWNSNDAGTGPGTSMNLVNKVGGLNLNDNTGKGINIAGGVVTVTGSISLPTYVGGINSNKTTPFTDPNQPIPSGFYDGQTATNVPYLAYWHLLNQRSDDTSVYTAAQRLTDFNDPKAVYTRNIVNSVASAWVRKSTFNEDITVNGNVNTTGNINATGNISLNGGVGGTIFADSNGVHTSNNLIAGGNIYWGTGGAYLSSYLNQPVLTTSSPTFANVYVTGLGWFKSLLNQGVRSVDSPTFADVWVTGVGWLSSYLSWLNQPVLTTSSPTFQDVHVTNINGGTALSTLLNQAVQTGSSVQFAGLTLTGGLSVSGNVSVAGNASATQFQAGTGGVRFNDGSVQTTSATNWPSSLNTNGYMKMPNGLIMQWGQITTNSATIQTVPFNIPFPNACLNINLTINSTSGFGQYPFIRSYTNSNFMIDGASWGAGNPVVIKFWFATGY